MLSKAEQARRVRRRRKTYIRTEADFPKNLREIERMRALLAEGKGNAATVAAIKRREEASKRWVCGETDRSPGA